MIAINQILVLTSLLNPLHSSTIYALTERSPTDSKGVDALLTQFSYLCVN